MKQAPTDSTTLRVLLTNPKTVVQITKALKGHPTLADEFAVTWVAVKNIYANLVYIRSRVKAIVKILAEIL